MIKSIVLAMALLSGGYALSYFYVGYPKAGKYYITKHREQRKSLRMGSGYYGTRMGSGSFRGGGK